MIEIVLKNLEFVEFGSILHFEVAVQSDIIFAETVNLVDQLPNFETLSHFESYEPEQRLTVLVCLVQVLLVEDELLIILVVGQDCFPMVVTHELEVLLAGVLVLAADHYHVFVAVCTGI